MTVSSSVNKVTYAGNSATTVFPVNYYFLENSHLQVILVSNNVETIQTITSQYTVTGAGNPAGGTVTMLTPPATGTQLIIVRNVPATQETDYLANDPFPAESHERALDKLTMLVQQVELDADRALKIPLSSLATTSTELPTPEANRLLAWNSNASAIYNFDLGDAISVVGQQASFSNVFTGNGVTVNFTLDRSPGNVNNVDVSVNGVTQVPNVDYILSGTTLTFTTAPPAAASKILARYSEVFTVNDADASNVRYSAVSPPITVEAALQEIDEELLNFANIIPIEIEPTISKISAFLDTTLTDARGDTFPNYMRRVVEYRRNIGDVQPYVAIAEKSINSTAVGYCLRYFARSTEEFSSFGSAYIAMIDNLALQILAMQHKDSRTARFGGFAIAPSDGTASAYNAAMCGLGLLAAYRLTLNPNYLQSAKDAATFLTVLNNPNPTYQALYGVTPISAAPGNAVWDGFCDQISASDTITISHTTCNLLGCKFLKELYEITGTVAYDTLYKNVRDWGAEGVTGFYDFWAVYSTYPLPTKVSNNWFATGLTVSDGQWHRRGEATVGGSAVRTGACTDAATLTITLDAGASGVDDAYNGMAIRMTSGASIAKGSIITDYNGTTKVATLKYQFPIVPTAGDTFALGLAVNTIGSDQMEYGIESLVDTDYTLSAIKTAYDALVAMPNADTGAFGAAYDARICWPGFFRIDSPFYGGASKAFGSHYDVQGIGPLLKFKKQNYPVDWALSFEKGLLCPKYGTLADQNFETVYSTDLTGLFQFATIGTGTVRGAIGLGLVESVNA